MNTLGTEMHLAMPINQNAPGDRLFSKQCLVSRVSLAKKNMKSSRGAAFIFPDENDRNMYYGKVTLKGTLFTYGTEFRRMYVL